VTLSVSGSRRETTLENGDVQTVFTGRNLFNTPEWGFVLISGEVTSVNNVFEPLLGEGQLTDLCGLLD
jgi:hypothetical protein